MGASEERLLALAASVSEGLAVDWQRAEGEASGDRERALVRELRLLEDVAVAWRLGEAEPVTLPTRWGSLEVLELLGSGGFGDVYRAFDPRLRRDVALKLLRGREHSDAGRGSLLLEEGQALARVRHPNVVTVYGADRIDGRVGLWMELVGGRTLAEELRRGGPMTAAAAGSAGACLAQALGAMHAVGVVHGDVKAQNVMVEGARYVLMDPGVGRAGTPAYLAPELERGGRLTARSDVYAMGVMLHHMLTGAFPKDGPLRYAKPDPPLRFVEVIERALSIDPARRYSDGRELEAAIRRAFGEPRRDSRRLFAAALLGGLALWIALGLLWPQRPPWSWASPRPVLQGSLTPAQRSLLDSLDRMAAIQTAMGAYAEAARSHERAQKVYEASLGPASVEVADRLRKRAFVLRAMGTRDDAKPLYERALAIYEKALGQEHALSVATLADLAALYEEMGAADRARALSERAQHLGPARSPVDPFVRPLGASSFEAQVTGPPSQDGPYTIQIALEPIESRQAVSLLVRASRPLYLYVLSEGDGDRCSLVYPLPGQERTNPVPAGSQGRVPGAPGWRRAVLGPFLVVIAAPERLLEFENELRLERVPAGGAPVESVPLSAATLSRLRESVRVDASARLFEAARPAFAHLEIVRGLWIRRIAL